MSLKDIDTDTDHRSPVAQTSY